MLTEQMATLQRKLVGLLHENDGLKAALSKGTSLMRRQYHHGVWGGEELEAALALADSAMEAVEAELLSTTDHGNLQVNSA